MSRSRAQPPLPLVLIVDDDLTTSLTLEGLLRGAGLNTIRTDTLTQAQTLFQAQPVALILLDVHLPDGSGLELCRKLSAASPVPILFISGDGDVTTKTAGFAAGGVDYITKPLSGAEVLARVRTHLRLRAAQESLLELQAERVQRLAGAQESLMPQPADLPEARFHVVLAQTLQAGGDFYDVIPISSQTVDYVVADASGHDLAASFWTAALKALLSEYANPLHSPLEVLRAVNQALCRMLPPGVFFTVIYARLNRRTRKLALANAGHPPAILLGSRQDQPDIVHQEADVLGAFPDAAFALTERTVASGDRFLLFSDGLIESEGSRQNGLARVTRAFSAHRSAALSVTLPAVLHEATESRPAPDDIVLMGVDV